MGASNPFTTEAAWQTDGSCRTVAYQAGRRRQHYGATSAVRSTKNKLFYFLNADQQTRNFPLTSVPGNPTAFFESLSAAELATLAGRGVTAAQAIDGLAFMQSLTGVVVRTGGPD